MAPHADNANGQDNEEKARQPTVFMNLEAGTSEEERPKFPQSVFPFLSSLPLGKKWQRWMIGF